MPPSRNYEPRRMWRRGGSGRERGCASCGARATSYASDLPFCRACLEWSRHGELSDWEDLGVND